MAVAAVVLAAGASTRMGRPKPLIVWRGRSFVEHCVARAQAAGCVPVVVVTGACEVPNVEGATMRRNSGWAKGPMSSLQTGVRALAEALQPSGVLVLTVDRPHVADETLRALVAMHVRCPGAFVQPCLGDKRGHPVLYPWALARQLLELAPTDTPRALLRGVKRLLVPVTDRAVLENLDTPQSLAALA